MTPNLDKHRRYVEVLEEILEELLKSAQWGEINYCDLEPRRTSAQQALQYFIGVGERMNEEKIILAMDSRRDYVNDSGDGLEELNLGEILNSKNIDKLAQAILTSLTGEETKNGKQD